ncbi:hypothetical protein GBAR_LOCUS20940, partial [Geodia barretti]
AIPEERTAFVRESIQYGICFFCAATGITTSSDMVQCDSCSKWYHTSCIGGDVEYFGEKTRFCCCEAHTKEESFEVVSCMRGKRRSVLFMNDIMTLWPNRGISDAVIDFFVR